MDREVDKYNNVIVVLVRVTCKIHWISEWRNTPPCNFPFNSIISRNAREWLCKYEPNKEFSYVIMYFVANWISCSCSVALVLGTYKRCSFFSSSESSHCRLIIQDSRMRAVTRTRLRRKERAELTLKHLTINIHLGHKYLNSNQEIRKETL